MVADSVAEDLIMQGQEFDPKQCAKNRIEIVKIWKEVKEKKAPKKEDKK